MSPAIGHTRLLAVVCPEVDTKSQSGKKERTAKPLKPRSADDCALCRAEGRGQDMQCRHREMERVHDRKTKRELIAWAAQKSGQGRRNGRAGVRASGLLLPGSQRQQHPCAGVQWDQENCSRRAGATIQVPMASGQVLRQTGHGTVSPEDACAGGAAGAAGVSRRAECECDLAGVRTSPAEHTNMG